MSNRMAMTALMGLFIPSAAPGDLLTSGGIFVQEYWQDGKLFYAVGNPNLK
jgi:hypothetical protein